MWPIASGSAILVSVLSLVAVTAIPALDERADDPCALIGAKKWVAPAEVRACLSSFPLNETIRNNILDVSSKMMAIHTSTNYQAGAPPPFAADVKEDLLASMARMRTQKYSSLYELHIDMSNTFKRVRDGHVGYNNFCFDSLFVSYVPLPLTHLNGTVYIAPEAYQVAQAEFSDQLDVWGSKLPVPLQNLSGAKVLSIDGADPWAAVDANSAVSGTFQAKSTRDAAFFSSYIVNSPAWAYRMGEFAQLPLPLKDEVTLSLQLTNATSPTTITLPYRSRFGSASANFTDGPSLWTKNCVAQNDTNGVDLNANPDPSITEEPYIGGVKRFQYPVDPGDERHALNTLMNDEPLYDITLPSPLSPPTAISGSADMLFYFLSDNKTGVLALGSFSGSFAGMMNGTYLGLKKLIDLGATQLIVDTSNNGGGYICVAHWLHRIIAGPSSKSEPQAGLNTQFRGGTLAQAITTAILADREIDKDSQLLYNPFGWNFENNTAVPATFNLISPGVPRTVNGKDDRFSNVLGNECQPFQNAYQAPDKPMFDPKTKVALVNNGRCGSSCALFTIAMNKHYGTPAVVYGGRPGVTQQYAGIVGGQSTDFTRIQSEAKTAKVISHPDFPPDYIMNAAQGITWRLGVGLDDPTQPEEWQSRPATLNFQHRDFTTVNNPIKMWQSIAQQVFV